MQEYLLIIIVSQYCGNDIIKYGKCGSDIARTKLTFVRLENISVFENYCLTLILNLSNIQNVGLPKLHGVALKTPCGGQSPESRSQ